MEWNSIPSWLLSERPKLPIDPEDLIIVEVERGEDIAQVTHLSVSGDRLDSPNGPGLQDLKRLANDTTSASQSTLEEEKAAQTFADILLRYPFEMKLIETVYQFDGNS